MEIPVKKCYLRPYIQEIGHITYDKFGRRTCDFECGNFKLEVKNGKVSGQYGKLPGGDDRYVSLGFVNKYVLSDISLSEQFKYMNKFSFTDWKNLLSGKRQIMCTEYRNLWDGENTYQMTILPANTNIQSLIERASSKANEFDTSGGKVVYKMKK